MNLANIKPRWIQSDMDAATRGVSAAKLEPIIFNFFVVPQPGFRMLCIYVGDHHRSL